MAIVRLILPANTTRPDELEPGQFLLADSDAATNTHAVLELEQWCRQHGLFRAQENHLTTIMVEGGAKLRRARCFRPYPEEIEERERGYEQMRRRVDAMPRTASSVELSKE